VFVVCVFADSFDGQVRHYKLYYEDGYHFVGECGEISERWKWGEGVIREKRRRKLSGSCHRLNRIVGRCGKVMA